MGFELKIPYGLPYEDNVLELQRSSEWWIQSYFTRALRMHDPAVVVLMEARTSGLRADEIVARTQFSRVSKVEARGIWLFWSIIFSISLNRLLIYPSFFSFSYYQIRSIVKCNWMCLPFHWNERVWLWPYPNIYYWIWRSRKPIQNSPSLYMGKSIFI